MLSTIHDFLETWRLQTRYRRIVQERLLRLAESTEVGEDADAAQWKPVSGTALATATTTARDPHELRRRARDLVDRHPYARNLLRLLEIYVAGPGLKLTHRSVGSSGRDDRALVDTCQRLWNEFQVENQGHWSFREHARRAWRDGETFVRKFAASGEQHASEIVGNERPRQCWSPSIRFVEPSQVDGTPEHPNSQGIITANRDAETPVAYLRHDRPASEGRLTVERIPATHVFHSRFGADSNERRGRSVFAPVLSTLDAYDRWLDTELQARRLQASIVLWRKVHGPPSVDAPLGSDGVKRERYRPGTIVTTSQGTELEFLQPKTNFSDAVGLGRQLLLAIAAGVGVPEYMLTADASNANFASTMVAEGPAVKLFQALQQWLADELTRFWCWIMQDAVDAKLLPADTFDRVKVEWTFPTLVARDRPSERMADVALLEHGVLSKAEVARRDGVDPEQMAAETGGDADPMRRSA